MKDKIIFITAYIDKKMYRRCVVNNKFIKQKKNVSRVAFDNSVNNLYISTRYNQFIDSWNYTKDAWFVFCHSDWELDEDIEPLLEKLSKESIYGPIGTQCVEDKNTLLNIYRGYCREMSRDDSETRILLCMDQRTGSPVDTLDAQCLIVHSSLVHKFGLRFDESFAFDLYCEDFSASAKIDHGIQTKILRIECCHHNIARSMEGREAYYDMLSTFNKKYPKNTFGSTVTVLGKTIKPIRHVLPVFLNIVR